MTNQIFTTDNEFFFEQVRPVTNRQGMNKPFGGLWTSSEQYSVEDGVTCPWMQWCKRNEFEDNMGAHAFRLIPKEDVKVFPLCRDIYNTLTDNGKKYIDWNFVEFFCKNHGYHGVSVNKADLKDLWDEIYGWDLPSTIWFDTDWIESVEKIW